MTVKVVLASDNKKPIALKWMGFKSF